MTDFVDINGESIPVQAWQYTLYDGDGIGLDQYPMTQYRDADRETIKRLVEDAGHEARDFEALVAVDDVWEVLDE